MLGIDGFCFDLQEIQIELGQPRSLKDFQNESVKPVPT